MKSASRVGESLQILILISHFRKKRSQMWFSFDPGEPSEIKILKKFQLFKKHLMTDHLIRNNLKKTKRTCGH